MVSCPDCGKDDQLSVVPDHEVFNNINIGMTFLFGGQRIIGKVYECRRCLILFGDLEGM